MCNSPSHASCNHSDRVNRLSPRITYLVINAALAFIVSVFLPAANANSKKVETDVMTVGGLVFAERCVLCHGNYGEGDGFMSLVIADYPTTNLFNGSGQGHFKELRKKVAWGGAKGQMSVQSPPWAEELSSSELEAVTQFVANIRSNPDETRQILANVFSSMPTNIDTGRLVYETRCTMCHGASGSGDGPLAQIVTSPPPFDLSRSELAADELEFVIKNGGSALGRSPQMPPWRDELTQSQIQSVILFIEEMRKDRAVANTDES